MVSLANITSSLRKCLDDPHFIARFCGNLRGAHPEFRAMCGQADLAEFAFTARKCITTAMLCASGALKTRVMLERMSHCEAQIWGRRDLFPVWVDCLIRTVDDYYPLPDEARSAWRRAMLDCHARL